MVGGLSEQRPKGFVVQARECSFGEKAGLDQSDRVPRRQSMGRRESGEYCVGLDQSWRGDDQRFPLRKSALHLRNGSLMVLVPRTHSGDHDASVGEKATHTGLGGGGSVAGEL